MWELLFEKHAEEHRPNDGPEDKSRCNSCGGEWPCSIIAGDLSPYD